MTLVERVSDQPRHFLAPGWRGLSPGGCSVAEHFVDRKRRPYLVDYGHIHFAERRLGIEFWVEEVVPRAVAESRWASSSR